MLPLSFVFYRTISNFNYSDPKWTMDNGCFIQEVYSKVKSAGFGTATYKKKVFMVGIYDYEMMTTDPLDLKHVTKPIRSKELFTLHGLVLFFTYSFVPFDL